MAMICSFHASTASQGSVPIRRRRPTRLREFEMVPQTSESVSVFEASTAREESPTGLAIARSSWYIHSSYPTPLIMTPRRPALTARSRFRFSRPFPPIPGRLSPEEPATAPAPISAPISGAEALLTVSSTSTAPSSASERAISGTSLITLAEASLRVDERVSSEASLTACCISSEALWIFSPPPSTCAATSEKEKQRRELKALWCNAPSTLLAATSTKSLMLDASSPCMLDIRKL
mmetsp:Transcript_21721/g.51540  ORF Transcript_21721/g.51540 Transcript_21721/m.51540 type:complete len:235 (-) Transcript_21721:592-1296(-)